MMTMGGMNNSVAAMRAVSTRVIAVIVGLVLAMVMALAVAVPCVWAAQDDWTVTFTGNALTSNGSANINKRLSGMQPGDSATFDITLYNDVNEEARWYMKNSVLKSMETELAKGGSYTYRLSYIAPDGKQTTIIGNEVVSGDGGNSSGLFDATTATGDWFFLDTLPAQGRGKVTLYVALDPESHGNSYFDTEARLQLEFAAETANGKLVTQDNPSGNNPGSSSSGDRGGFRLPSTGDMLMFGLPIVAIILALVALGLHRKRSGAKEEGGK